MRTALKKLYYRLGKNRTFPFDGARVPYEYALNAWATERTFEVSAIRHLLEEHNYREKRVLEVGNVLHQYMKHSFDVVDKYEKFPGVLNKDIVTYTPKAPYDLVVTISTLEHVGWDEEPKEEGKIFKAFDNMRRCLKPGGVLLYTVPTGYNPVLDRQLKDHLIPMDTAFYYKRLSKINEWGPVSEEEVLNCRYDEPYPAANGIVLGVVLG